MIFCFTTLSAPPESWERPAAPFEAKRNGPWDQDQQRHLRPGESYRQRHQAEDGALVETRFEGIKPQV